MKLTPASELEQRILKLQQLLQADGLDAVIMAQNADLYYFAGTVQNGSLYVPASGEALFLVRRELGRAREESGLKHVLPYGSPKDIPARLAEFLSHRHASVLSWMCSLIIFTNATARSLPS
jgi:Xaa-Pro dipeptidase